MEMKVPEYFASIVFDDAVMRERLPKDTYRALKKTVRMGQAIDIWIANVVANAMKDWAVEKGATHLHALVPADDGHHGRKARQLYLARRPTAA